MNQSKIYVGNLSYDTSSNDLTDLFNQFGDILETKLITDRETGRSKGFAFITFTEEQSANNALDLNGTDHMGRKIKVNIAKDDRRTGGGGGGHNGGGGYR